MLSLWQRSLQNNINYLESTPILPQIESDGNSGCDYIQQICNLGACCTAMCAYCTPNNISAFMNITYYDNITPTNLASCASSCTNQNLMNLSSNAYTQLNTTVYWTDLQNLLRETLGPLDSVDLKTYLGNIVCDVSTPVGLTYTGCGIILGGIVICLIICLILRGGSNNEKS